MARWPSIVPAHRPSGAGEPLMEALESRIALYSAPMLSNMPSIDVLEDPTNTVVRFQTNFGIFDIELFDSVAPTTVANFLSYLNDGAYDEMFFHRVTDVATTGIAVLQGGGFKFRDGTGKYDVEANDPIVNEFQRPNVEGTIAMAKLGGDPNSATCQFYFNLVDNPALDNPANNGGFTVFGRVIQGWTIVEAAGAATARDLDLELTGFNSPFGGTFDAVPTHSSYNTQVGPKESSLVYTWDAEVIKSRNLLEFYDEAVYIPEGWRGESIQERVDLENTLPLANYYQIIVRYETGERDEMITTGTIPGRGRRGVLMTNGTTGLVRPGVGYAIEVRSTSPLAASLNHRDFGVTLAESFQRIEDFSSSWLTKWTFAHGSKGLGFKSFILWQNVSDKDAVVSMTIYRNSGAPQTFHYSLPRYSRGGVNIGVSTVIGNGRYSVHVTSTQPIVATLSVYETNEEETNGSLASGIPAGGRTEGYLAAAQIPSNGSSFLSFVYTQAAPASVVVDVFFYLTNGTVLTAANPVTLTTAVRRVDRNLAAFGVPLPANQIFSVGYKVRNNAGSVSATYVSEANGDTMSTPFAVVANRAMYFADGLFDPAQMFTGYHEVVSIFNPYTNPNVQFGYRLRFRFSDGTEFQGPSGTLPAHGRIDIITNQISQLVAKVQSNPQQYKFYSMIIETGQTVGVTPIVGAGFAQITRVHPQPNWQQSMTSLPMLDEGFPLIWANAPQFD